MKTSLEMKRRVCFVLISLTSLQVFQALGLTIDNHLVIIANDCYTRISIGSGLLEKDVSLSIGINTVSDCENECSKRRNSCKVFSFGISAKGNGTCAIGSQVPKDFQVNPDYDVYVRHQDSFDCEPEQLYKIENDSKHSYDSSGYIDNNDKKPTVGFGNNLLPPKSSTFHSSNTNQAKERPVFYGSGKPWDQRGWFLLRDNDKKLPDTVNYNNDREPNVKSPYNDSRFLYYANNVHDFGRPIRKRPFNGRFPSFNDGSQFHKDISYPEVFGTTYAEKPSANNDYHVTPTTNYEQQSIVKRPGDFSSNFLRTNTEKMFNRTNFQVEYNGKENSNFPKLYEFSKPKSSVANYGFWIDHNLRNSQYSGLGYNHNYDNDHRLGSKNLYSHRTNGQSTGYDKIYGFDRFQPVGSDLVNYNQNNPKSPINSYNFYGYGSNARGRPQNEKFQTTYPRNFDDFGNLWKNRYNRVVEDNDELEKIKCK